MLWPLALTVAVWVLAAIIIGRAYPEAVQFFTVKPNQFAQEDRYIANNIAMTRLAFGLDTWEDRNFQGEAILTPEMIAKDADTFTNARLWDYRPLGDTLNQLQIIRQYYTFPDVDTDRYQIGRAQRQVMLSGRELDITQSEGATGFVNQRIIYTHGIGVAMVPVNEVANEGQPRLFISNLPPVSTDGAPTITQPRIYFGELPNSYVVTGARQDEFDYPTGEGEGTAGDGTSTRWTGTTGIKLDTTLMRLLFAARFRDIDLLISDQVTAESQLLMHRFLADRLPRIAPFLQYDKDPYLVVDDAGKLVYVQDAYTTSDRFPDAQSFDPATLTTTALRTGPINYIRNSVKITMDAYDGTMHFYVSDPSDPIIRAYSGIFPSLFEPMSALPVGLTDHLRVPEELFNIQTRMFGRYHVTDTERFFSGNDLWTVPTDQGGSEQTLPSEAYYVVMRMPGEPKAEFLLLQPMVPVGRLNMIAWVAARMDPPNYGTTRAYRFPADTTIFGPGQIESRIDQDPIISQQFTLWNQSGSSVIRGNLIVVPVGDSLLYLQPVYLQSTGSAFPEFRRIIVASPREVVWAETLSESLRLLLEAENENGGGLPAPSPGATPTPAPGRVADATAHDGTPGTAPERRRRPDHVRQDPFRPRPGSAPQRRFRPLRRGDRSRRRRAPAARRARPGPRPALARGIVQPRPMSIGAALLASFLVTLVRPATWALALAAFLVRGGVLLVLAPIVVLPSAVGLGELPGPGDHDGRLRRRLDVAGPARGRREPWGRRLARHRWLAGRGARGGDDRDRRDGRGDRLAPTGGGVAARPAAGAGVALRILVVRLVALLPFAVGARLGRHADRGHRLPGAHRALGCADPDRDPDRARRPGGGGRHRRRVAVGDIVGADRGSTRRARRRRDRPGTGPGRPTGRSGTRSGRSPSASSRSRPCSRC